MNTRDIHSFSKDILVTKYLCGVVLVCLLFGLRLLYSYAGEGGGDESRIYVADQKNIISRMDDMTGKNLTTLGNPEIDDFISLSGPNHFFDPRSIYVAPDGKIYVADTGNFRIVRMDDMAGKNWTTLGTLGLGPKQFRDPSGIYVDKAGKIYVSDADINRIVRMDDMSGAGWTTIGTDGSGTGQFNQPFGIFVDSDGKIYVADTGANSRIVRMDDMTGKGWITIGGPTYGRGINQFAAPTGIFVAPDGKIYVADSRNHRIVRMDDMTGAGWITLGETMGRGINQFTDPDGIAVDTTGKIYVADSGNYRIVRIDDMTGAGWTTFDTGDNMAPQHIMPHGIFLR